MTTKTTSCCAATIKALDPDERRITFAASVEEKDRVGDIIRVAGIDVAANPPLCIDHDRQALLGKILKFTKGTVTGNKPALIVDALGLPKGLDPRADACWEQIVGGYRTAWSIGFGVLDSEPLPDGGTLFKRIDLHEVSSVLIPACRSCQTLKALPSAEPHAAEMMAWLMEDDRGKRMLGTATAEAITKKYFDYVRVGYEPAEVIVKHHDEETFELDGEMVNAAELVEAIKACVGPALAEARCTLDDYGAMLDQWRRVPDRTVGRGLFEGALGTEPEPERPLRYPDCPAVMTPDGYTEEIERHQRWALQDAQERDARLPAPWWNLSQCYRDGRTLVRRTFMVEPGGGLVDIAPDGSLADVYLVPRRRNG